MNSARKIDSHQHVFWHGRDDAGLIADMDEQGIEKAWLLTWKLTPVEDEKRWHGILNPLNLRADGSHAGITLRDLITARDRYPDRFELGYCPHPLLGNAPELLRAAVKIHGVRVCGEWKFRVPFDDPRCIELFRVAGELNLPVVLHLDVPYLGGQYDPSWFGGTVDNLERALVACPDTIFIGHAPGFWREISGDADECAEAYPRGAVTPGGRVTQLLEKYPNLYADLSAGSGRFALERDLEFTAQFMENFAEKLLFARDYYGGELQEVLDVIEVSPRAIQQIYYGNALKLLGE